MQVNIGKGIELTVDVDKLNAAVMGHVVYIGLRNILMDAHASVTNETNPNDLGDVARAVSEKKLAAMYAGEVRVAGSREGDPVRAEAIRIATDAVKKAIRKAGRKVADVDGKDIRAAALLHVEKNPAILELAKKRVDEQRALGGDVDVDSLIS